MALPTEGGAQALEEIEPAQVGHLLIEDQEVGAPQLRANDAGALPALQGRPDVLAAVEGFAAVELDPRGFRSGSMNELLPDPVRYR